MKMPPANAALQYYNDYFDDAGAEKEEEIIAELGSPEEIAAVLSSRGRLTSNIPNWRINSSLFMQVHPLQTSR